MRVALRSGWLALFWSHAVLLTSSCTHSDQLRSCGATDQLTCFHDEPSLASLHQIGGRRNNHSEFARKLVAFGPLDGTHLTANFQLSSTSCCQLVLCAKKKTSSEIARGMPEQNLQARRHFNTPLLLLLPHDDDFYNTPTNRRKREIVPGGQREVAACHRVIGLVKSSFFSNESKSVLAPACIKKDTA